MAVDPVIAPPPHEFKNADGKTSLIVDLPMLQSLSDMTLNIGTSEIQLCLPGGSTSLISLPKEISASSEAQNGAAKFSRKRGQLTISWPVGQVVQTAETLDDQASEQVVALEDPTPQQVSESGHCIESKAENIAKSLDESGEDTAASLESSKVDGNNASSSTSAPTDAAKSQKAYGSLWNANSWHWEEKNCIELISEQIIHALESCSAEKLKHVNDLSGASVHLTDITVGGEGSFSLRRGKRILYYEVSVSFNWNVRDAYGGALGAKGKGKVTELTQEDEVPQVSIEVSTTFSGGKEAKAAGEWMRRKGALAIGEFLLGPRISAAVLAAEEARSNAKQDAARRKEERQKADAARQETGIIKDQLAVNQKQIEEARRSKPAEGAVQGSVWNANAWHWEEKPMTTWAHSWMKKSFENLTVSLFGGLATATFSEPEVTGDASISIRKGKPITLFQLRVECKWEITASAAGVGEGKGILLIPEFTSEDGAKGSAVEVQGKGNAASQLLSTMRRDAVRSVRGILQQFTDQLLSQIDRSSS